MEEGFLFRAYEKCRLGRLIQQDWWFSLLELMFRSEAFESSKPVPEMDGPAYCIFKKTK
jgi:hypothetical protein